MENQVSVFVKPPEPTFPLNPNRQSWSKWHWHDVVADWNWAGYEEQAFEVSVYSSCDETELFLNGKSLGKKKTGKPARFMAGWEVPYRPGELKAIGYRGKKAVAESILNTSGETRLIKISPDRTDLKADNQDLSYLTIELTDEKGVRNPKEERLLKFRLEGDGSIVGVGNANPVSLESYQLPQRRAWQGRCLVVIKSGRNQGSMTLTVTAEGLPAASTVITTK
jgi:beta-galactosidase